MKNSLPTAKLQFRLSGYISLLVMLLVACLVTSCDDEEEMNIEPETFVYLVTLNEEPDLKSLTIVDLLDGTGSLVVPDIQAHASNRFDLIIDRVDNNRANISAVQPEVANGSTVTGVGFFTVDSVYMELTIDGFTNRDILSGSR